MAERIVLTDSVFTALTKLSENNPGALNVLAGMLKEGKAIDPDSIDPLLSLLALDSLGVYGPRIWMLFKDVCGQRLSWVLGLLRAWQLGLVNEPALNHAIDNRGEGLDLPTLLAEVKVRLPNFQLTD